MKVKITEPARQQLDRIDDYYRKEGNPSKGRKLRQEIVKKSGLLSKNPYLGQEEEQLKQYGRGHRYLLIEPFYKLIYLILKPIIYITDIFDTRQDPDEMKP